MGRPNHRSWSLPLSLGIALILLLGSGGGMAWLLAKQGARRAPRILLVTPPLEGGEEGLGPAEGRAIGAMIQDHLEHSGGFAVTAVTSLPPDLALLRGQAGSLLVELHPRRQGDDLAIPYRFVWGDQLGSGEIPWTVREAPPATPIEAMGRFLHGFPQGVGPAAGDLTPRMPAVFWDLVRSGALRYENRRLEEAMELAERAAFREPECAGAWILLGNLRYRRMLNSPAAFRQEQADTEAHLQQGLALAPDHPRASFLLSLLKADSGAQADALDLLFKARRKQLRNPTLLTGVVYAARCAGLLPLARRAMDLRDRLAFSEFQPQAVDITCLYTGEIPRFEASLKEQPGHIRSTSGVLPFYRGYLALVRGDRPQAKQAFLEASSKAHGYPNILRLSEIYRLILDNRKEEAWKRLRDYDQERIGMREPDGEFTLRLAEAYALMGDRASALEMAYRAFARGFGCTAWYEQSPMLEPLRDLPKWKALMQHLRERQRLMEERFPISLLEEN